MTECVAAGALDVEEGEDVNVCAWPKWAANSIKPRLADNNILTDNQLDTKFQRSSNSAGLIIKKGRREPCAEEGSDEVQIRSTEMGHWGAGTAAMVNKLAFRGLKGCFVLDGDDRVVSLCLLMGLSEAIRSRSFKPDYRQGSALLMHSSQKLGLDSPISTQPVFFLTSWQPHIRMHA